MKVPREGIFSKGFVSGAEGETNGANCKRTHCCSKCPEKEQEEVGSRFPVQGGADCKVSKSNPSALQNAAPEERFFRPGALCSSPTKKLKSTTPFKDWQ